MWDSLGHQCEFIGMDVQGLGEEQSAVEGVFCFPPRAQQFRCGVLFLPNDRRLEHMDRRGGMQEAGSWSRLSEKTKHRALTQLTGSVPALFQMSNPRPAPTQPLTSHMTQESFSGLKWCRAIQTITGQDGEAGNQARFLTIRRPWDKPRPLHRK